MYLSNTFKNNFLIYFLLNNAKNTLNFFFFNFIKTNFIFKNFTIYFLDVYKRTFGDGFLYVRGLFLIFFIDACVTDDEPL